MQEVADALNGAQEAKCHNITVPDYVEDIDYRPSFEIKEDSNQIYVSTTGSDNNSGSKSSPVKTL